MSEQYVQETKVPTIEKKNTPEAVETSGGLTEQPKLQEPTKIERSVLARAKKDDKRALEEIFRSFILTSDEELYHAEYLGLQGLWGLGVHSFGCITDRRIATIRTAPFKEVIYQDGYLEYVNSGAIIQPSRLWLYIIWILVVLINLFISFSLGSVIGTLEPVLALIVGVMIFIGINFLLIPLSTRIFYGFKKCGLLFWIREGLAVYMFANHNRLFRARNLYKLYSNHRENRLSEIGSLH